MNLHWEIKEMRRDHLEQVMEIERKSFSTSWRRDMFIYELTSPISYNFVATRVRDKEELVLGYIIFWMVSEEVHILNLAIDPPFRRVGIAHSLLLFSLDFSYKKGGRVYILEVRKKNRAAINLYKKVGFVPWWVRKEYYADTGDDAIVMRLFFDDRPCDQKGNGQRRIP